MNRRCAQWPAVVVRDRRYPRQHVLSDGFFYREHLCRRLPALFVFGGRVLAAVGWWVRWLGWRCGCFFGGESGDCFLVFRHRGDWCTPGWDERHACVEPVHVAAPGRPLWVIIIDPVVVGA